MPLVVFGLLVSVPIIVWGSQIVIKLMDRFPLIITLGGMLLGWIAGGMMITDVATVEAIGEPPASVRHAASAAGAALVVLIGRVLSARRRAAVHAD